MKIQEAPRPLAFNGRQTTTIARLMARHLFALYPTSVEGFRWCAYVQHVLDRRCWTVHEDGRLEDHAHPRSHGFEDVRVGSPAKAPDRARCDSCGGACDTPHRTKADGVWCCLCAARETYEKHKRIDHEDFCQPCDERPESAGWPYDLQP